MASLLHTHCSTCVNLHCAEPSRPGSSCEVTSCPLACGSSFHSCKGAEHRLLCPLESVPCPSQCYGCPVSLPRARVAKHLSVCPASVVRCRHTHFPNIRPAAATPTHAHALSPAGQHSADTHTASDAHASSTHASLAQVSCVHVSSTPSQVAGFPAQSELNGEDMAEGTTRMTCKNISTAENVVFGNNVFINGIRHDPKQCVAEVTSTRKPIGLPAVVVMDTFTNQSDRGKTSEGGTEDGCGGTSTSVTSESRRKSPSEPDALLESECLITHAMGDLDAFPPSFDREVRLQLLQRFLPQGLSVRLANPPANYNDGPIKPLDQPMEVCPPTHNCPGTDESETITKAREGSQVEACCVHIPPSHTTTIDAAAATVTPSQAPPLPSGTETATSGAFSYIHQDTIEDSAFAAAAAAAGSESNSDSDSGAVCGRLFRRDEFPWHSRNVHADLDLLERCCPLATYGCPLVQRRLTAPRGTLLRLLPRHQGLEGSALSLLPAPPPVAPDPQALDRLSALPLELQRHLLGYLDAFSLGQLAATSSHLREVCAGMLCARGIVALRWVRGCHGDDDDNNNSSRGAGCGGGGGEGGDGVGRQVCRWKVQDKVWCFSTAFSPVECWDMANAPCLSNHLRCCRWNQVERHLVARAPLHGLSGRTEPLPPGV